MKTLYIDIFSGISGDMFVGALLDAGASFENLKSGLDSLKLHDISVTAEKTSRSGIGGTKFSVHTHEHHHNHGHHHEHRRLSDILKIIDGSPLSAKVKKTASDIFTEIGRAEAAVHGVPAADVAFHEVGAADSIADIVGAAILLHDLGIEKVVSSPLCDGHGSITCAHGVIPVPVPAVAQMLAGTDIPCRTADVPTELITPTGMGIVKVIACSYGLMPSMTVAAAGYGFGDRDTGGLNALRVFAGNTDCVSNDEICVIETNLDDCTGEDIAYACDKLLQAGAADVFTIPCAGKKNRPAILLTVLCDPQKQAEMSALLFKHTTAFGVRYRVQPRDILSREFTRNETKYGVVTLKHGAGFGVSKTKAEFEDVKKAAEEYGVPLCEVRKELKISEG